MRNANAQPRARKPREAISGSELAVEGKVLSALPDAGAASGCAGGAVTTSAISTSSPVGLIAMIDACFSWITTGTSAEWMGSATSTGSSAEVKSTGVLVSLASAIALALG